MENVLILVSIISAAVIALTELTKQSIPAMPKNLVPVVGLIIGLVVAAVAYPFTDLGLVERLWAGGLAGLGGTGLYELGFKNRPGDTKK